MADNKDPGSTVFYRLLIDGLDLGLFNTCEGFSVQAPAEQHEEGGTNTFTWQFPTRLNFTNIRLSRPINEDSNKANQWMQASVAVGFLRPSAEITALRADGSEVCTWELNEVTPVGWDGPHFDSSSPGVATESVELAYHGFVGPLT